jgi:hypothetical protein
MIISEAFADFDISYANTISGLGTKSGVPDCVVISDCNRSSFAAAVQCVKDVVQLLNHTKPDVIVSTGALPGLIALAIGKLRGAYCIWIDSVANAEKLSASGKTASLFCDLCISQWAHVSEAHPRVKFFGSVL